MVKLIDDFQHYFTVITDSIDELLADPYICCSKLDGVASLCLRHNSSGQGHILG